MIPKLIVVFSEATDSFYFLSVGFALKAGNIGKLGQNPNK